MLRIVERATEKLNDLEQEFFKMQKDLQDKDIQELSKEEQEELLISITHLYTKIQVISNIVKNQLDIITNKIDTKKEE